jgi:hypothetical protein
MEFLPCLLELLIVFGERLFDLLLLVAVEVKFLQELWQLDGAGRQICLWLSRWLPSALLGLLLLTVIGLLLVTLALLCQRG